MSWGCYKSKLKKLGFHRSKVGLGSGSNCCGVYSLIYCKLLFALFPSIKTFDFDFILWLFLTFCCPNGLFLGSMWGLKTVLGYTHVVEQLSFSMIPCILTLKFDLILGSFCLFEALMGLE